MNLTNLSVIKEILARHEFSFSKKLGQNFLINPTVCPKMADSVLRVNFTGEDNVTRTGNSQDEDNVTRTGNSQGEDNVTHTGNAQGEDNVTHTGNSQGEDNVTRTGNSQSEKHVLEIGPGIGVLTQELAKRADRVLAVEIDKMLIPVLKETLAEYNNITVLNADFLTLDLEEVILQYFYGENIAAQSGNVNSIELCDINNAIQSEIANSIELHGGKIAICANLPYYITSPIIMHILESSANRRGMISSITCLVQKEVAERFAAQNSAIALAIHYYGDVKKLFGVKKGSFIPAPKVDSAVIEITIHNKFHLNADEEQNLFKIIKPAYMQRRKTLANSLSKLYDKELSNRILEERFKNANIRPEELVIEDFIEVSKIYEKESCGYIRRSEF
jgi:16S rRNA (adenine1518-N6/adenine1519-N6)-dimethyltransferase